MEFEIIDLNTRRTKTVKVPPGRNPVRIGNHPQADVFLPSPLVGSEVGAFENDGSGKGWKFWNFNGREIEVIDTIVESDGAREQRTKTWEVQHFVRVLGRIVRLEHRPEYLITVKFDNEELQTRADDNLRMDRQASELVVSLHRELNRLLTGPGVDKGDEYSSEYLLALEKRIEDLARGRHEFPSDDSTHTPVGNHLAGVCVRAELIRKLSEEAGEQAQKLRSREYFDSWSELKVRDPAREDDLGRLVLRAKMALGLDKIDDLTAKMKKVKNDMWGYWYELLKNRDAPSYQTRRYLALRRVKKEIKDLNYGFGPLEDLLDDPTISEIMVVDKDHIFIEKGGSIEDSGIRFLDDSSTQSVIEKVAAQAGRVLNDEMPLLDAMMGDGSRVNAVHKSLALKGPCLTIRRFPRKRLNIDDLVYKFKSISLAGRNFIEASVINRRNVLVAGGTGSGKTTFLNCLSMFIPDKERIVTIEDTAELQLQKIHVVTLQTRKKTSNDEKSKEVLISDLVKNALRMRPDRIVVGECRGAEGLYMLQAMNTGHDGSLTTLHANTPKDVVLRLQSMCLEANPELPVSSINRMIASAIDLVVQLRVVTIQIPQPDGTIIKKKAKYVVEISEFEGLDEETGEVAIRSLFIRDGDGSGPLRSTGSLATFFPDLQDAGLIKSPLDLMQ